MTRLATHVAFALLVLLTGCANVSKMPLLSGADIVSPTGKPIFLASVTLKNSYRTRYQPELKYVYVSNDDGSADKTGTTFAMDSEGTYSGDNEDAPPTYLVRLEMDPGKYTLRGFMSVARGFPFIVSFYTPIHAPVTASKSGVYYLGAIDAVVRERQGDEFKAGPSIPLIDQAVGGASGGTFDVVISDNWSQDEPRFRKTFPALGKTEITKSVLPAFDRARAQQWWEAH